LEVKEEVKAEIINNPKTTKYTFEDFTNEPFAPFKYVAQYREDDFRLMAELEKMNQKAKKVGISNFKGMFKKYIQDNFPQQKTMYTNLTAFTGQKLELGCGRYYCDDSGISYDNPDKGITNIEVCNHPIMPIQRLVNIDDNTEKLKIAYKKGKKWREIIVDKETLASANKILSLAKYGIAVNSENAKYLVKFLTDIEAINFDLFEELNSVGRLGWINKKGFSPYVDDLVFDGMENFRSFFSSVHPQGKYEKWLDLVKSIRKEENSVVARITLATSFASILVEKCDCLPFFLHLWGGTESGKTVALMLATSVWANPAMGDYIHTFNSTNVAQELNASFVNSLPLIIDELQIIKDRKSFDNLIYQLAEGVGRSRGQKTGGVQKVGTWKNCIMTNGEFPISTAASGGGAVNRVIEIDCKDVKIFSDPRHVLDIIKYNYGGAGRLFVELLSFEEISQNIKKRQKELFHDLLDNSDITEKQATSASLILLADEIIEQELFQDGIRLNTEDIKPYLSTKSQIDQNKRCLDFIYDYIVINSKRFEDNKESGETWGVKDFDTIYIIRSIFDRILRDNGYNATAFLSWAKSKKLIKASNGVNTITKRINGNVCRCVALIVESETSGLSENNTLESLENDLETEDLPF